MANETTCPCTVDELLDNWLGHRRLTRRVIEAFPEDKLFTFSVGGMRPFGELANEFLGMELPVVQGELTGNWEKYGGKKVTGKADLLRAWDEHTEQIKTLTPRIPAHRFHEEDLLFGQWKMTGIAAIQYAMDNEIHHRGQGYVYLRALGIEPPAFWDRS